MKNLYLYVSASKYCEILKYGIKLSQFANKTFNILGNEKKGIVAYLAPEDFNNFGSEEYICLKINTNNLKIYIQNNELEQYSNIQQKILISSLEDYTIGQFENPIAIICTSILPENISLYNNIIDTPLLIKNSKEYYYKKSINELLEDDIISNKELYEAIISVAKSKKIIESTLQNENVEIYIDNKTKKIYTLQK